MRTDTEAISTWERNEREPEDKSPGAIYVCLGCDWRKRGGARAQAHHSITGHALRGRDWPASWGNAVFTPRVSVDAWLSERGTL